MVSGGYLTDRRGRQPMFGIKEEAPFNRGSAQKRPCHSVHFQQPKDSLVDLGAVVLPG